MARTDVRGYEVYGAASYLRPLVADDGFLVFHGPSLAWDVFSLLWRAQRPAKTYEASDAWHETPRKFF